MSMCERHSFRYWNSPCSNPSSLSGHRRLIGLFLAMMLMESMPLPLAAQPLNEVNKLPGLKPGNELTVLAASSRSTTIIVDGQPAVTTESSETSQIQYRVVGKDPAGNLAIRVFVHSFDRQPRNGNLSRLRVAPMFLEVQPDGGTRILNPASRNKLIIDLSNDDPESMQILNQCLSDETIAAWFSIPFWMLQPVGNDDVADSWHRDHEVSFGSLGSLHLDLNFQPDAAENGFANVAITGESRFRPLVLPDSAAVVFPFLSEAHVEIDEISGIGKRNALAADSGDAIQPRPEFESVDWSLKLHGDARLSMSKPADSIAGPGSIGENPSSPDTSHKAGRVTFSQTQRHVWTLQRYSTGMQGMFDYPAAPGEVLR
jgi:hypothetical protein